MKRGTVIGLILVVAALSSVALGLLASLRQQRAEAIERFNAEQLQRVTEAAQATTRAFTRVAEVLDFASELVGHEEPSAERMHQLRSLVILVREVQRAAIYDPEGGLALEAVDPTVPTPPNAVAIRAAMAATAARSLREKGTVLSKTIRGDRSGFLRVFSVRLRSGGALALLVDTGSYFDALRVTGGNAGTRSFITDRRDLVEPLSDRALRAAVQRSDYDPDLTPRFRELVGDMRAGERGVSVIDEREAQAIGFPAVDVAAAFVPMDMPGRVRWAVATFTPLGSLRAMERSSLIRLTVAALVVALALVGFGRYLFGAVRQEAALSERLRRADELAILHEKTDKILDNIPTCIVALDEAGRITAVNRALRERVRALDGSDSAAGKPAAEGGGQPPRAALDRPAATLAELFPGSAPPVVRRLQALLESARRSQRVQSLLGERLALFGDEGQYNLHAVPLAARDHPTLGDARALLVVEDLSEVRALASQLLRAEKLATVGVLAAGIAHEIGTPLSVVRGRAEYVAGKLGADHPQREGMLTIVEQIDAVSRTIRQLLDFARVRPATVSPVDVLPVAMGVFELLRYEAERRRVKLTVYVERELPRVAADPGELEQVLVNLVMNACDACEIGGHVSVTAKAEPAGSPGDGLLAPVRIEVADDGCGIPTANRDRIFDPFFTTKKRGQGTGLGLSIVAQIVRNHGGQIEVESQRGRGTRMSVLWPAVAEETQEIHEGRF